MTSSMTPNSAEPARIRKARVGMSRFRWASRSLSLAPATALFLAVAVVAPRVGLGQAKAAGEEIDLLKSPPFDRITLKDDKVLMVEPLAPRPLPPPVVVKDKAKKKTKVEAAVGVPGEEIKAAAATEVEEDDPANILTIHLTSGDLRDFKVSRNNIKSIEYYEDILLARGETHLRNQEYAKAFEHYLAAKSRSPSWPGVDDHVDKLLFEEGAQALAENDGERGLRLLRELSARKPDYPKLAETMTNVYAAQIARAFHAGAFPQARRFLHEMEKIAPNSARTKDSRNLLTARAKQLVEQASKAAGPEKLEALTEAMRIWPSLDGASARFEEAFRAEPTLDVGVVDLPRPSEDRAAKGGTKPTPGLVGPWARSPSAERLSRLLYLPVLADEGEEAVKGSAPGQLCAALELGMLGQRMNLTIRPGLPWSDGTRPAAAIDVVRALSDRADPRSPGYNARWADLLERVEATEESRVEVRLTRVPLRPESWLLLPVGPAHAAWDGWASVPGAGRQPVGDGPFRWEGATDAIVRVRAANAGESSGSSPKIKHLREVRFANETAALGALLRGDVSLIEHVPTDRVAGLSKTAEVKVGKYAHPSLHRIALDGRNPILRNRALRRGLSYAIHRKGLLEESVLKGPSGGDNVPSDGPFPKGSYADAGDVKPLDYDPLLAKMLVVAAKKELGLNALKLNFEYPATPEAQAVVPKIVEAMRVAGVELKATERPAAELEEDLRNGRRFDLAYRVSRMAEPAFDAGPSLCPGYDAPADADGLASLASPRILQLLLQLEQAGEAPSAKATLLQIDAESRDELPILPLWQLSDHYAWRTRLAGPADAADHLYRGIETWEIAPWYAKDPW